MKMKNRYNPAPYALDLNEYPNIITAERPGPKSQALHARCTKHFKGLSEQVKLFPVDFESGKGCSLIDADGNKYIDFSSGIYVTTLGHCHPKVSEAIAKYANTLMNAHDFTSEIKTRLCEKLAEILPGDLKGFQFYDCGTAAVEAGQRICRAATKKHELISCFHDFHGKTYGAVSLGHIRSTVYGATRAPGNARLKLPCLARRPLLTWLKPTRRKPTLRFCRQKCRSCESGTCGSFPSRHEAVTSWPLAGAAHRHCGLKC